MKKSLLLFLAAAGLLSSCSTDFNVNAPYRETMVIYGLLNVKDTAQYIRISKAYLGEGNALVMAQQPDSINYADILDVSLVRIINNTVVDSFNLSRIDTIPKDSGIFAFPYQVFYYTNHPLIDDTARYRLTVRNRQTGVTATSVTRLAGDVNIQHPTSQDVDFSLPFPYTADLYPGTNSKVFDLIIRFHYTETDSSTGIKTIHYVDWDQPDQLAGQNQNSLIAFHYNRSDFWSFLGSAIPVKSGVERRVDDLPSGILPFEFRFMAGTEDLYTYQQLSLPSTSIVQDRPLFTTVVNGIGLFTSRLIHSEFRNMNANTRAAFDTSAYTQNLNFRF
ncbi:MAG: DUF4249 family protein [Bacteroidia bacterium]|nr:DUF4249 family protein [Bacteroidia bacterium]